jgi:hypothetical protein
MKIKKWLICSWLHKKWRCYPRVWELDTYIWHCSYCEPCSNELDKLLKNLSIK